MCFGSDNECVAFSMNEFCQKPMNVFGNYQWMCCVFNEWVLPKNNECVLDVTMNVFRNRQWMCFASDSECVLKVTMNVFWKWKWMCLKVIMNVSKASMIVLTYITFRTAIKSTEEVLTYVIMTCTNVIWYIFNHILLMIVTTMID